jgi:hypothetical protein
VLPSIPNLADETRPGTEVRILADGRAFDAVLASLPRSLMRRPADASPGFDLAPGSSAARAVDGRGAPARSAGKAWRMGSGLGALAGAARHLDDPDRGGPGERGATIATEAVEVLRLDGERAFVRGSFADGARYLADGTHRVVPGETVVLAEAE